MQTLFKRLTTLGLMVILIISTSITVYADNPIDEYIDAQGEDLYAAYQVFLNARGAGLTTASKKAFIAWMQSDTANSAKLLGEIKRSPLYYTNISFYFNVKALTFLNSKLNEWASKYNIATSEQYSNDNTVNTVTKIYSGEVFQDADGNSCLVYHINNTTSEYKHDWPVTNVSEFGTSLKYGYDYFSNVGRANFEGVINLQDKSVNIPFTYFNDTIRGYTRQGFLFNTFDNPMIYFEPNGQAGQYGILDATNIRGCITVVKLINLNKYYISTFTYPFGTYSSTDGTKCSYYVIQEVNNTTDADIDIKAPTGVLPDLPTDAPMYIIPKDKDGNYYKTVNNYIDDSTTYINAPDIQVTPPVNEPNSPDEPEQPTPSGGGQLVPDGDGGFNFNFDLPDFSGFNFSIEGLNQKFPFSIPWDLMAFFTVLNAEPVTPELKGSLPFGDIYTWNFDFNLHEFDGIAAILRNIEFIAFCVGLMLITRQLIKG